MPFHILMVALGGALGASARFLISLGMSQWMGSRFPWGTLTVNLVGSFLMGLIFGIVSQKSNVPLHVQRFLMVGFLGSFTTFSSFALDNVHLLQTGPKWMVFNMLFKNITGVLLVLLGIACARWF